MGRLSALALALCVGCAGNDSFLTEDGIWGDLASRCSSAPRYAPTSPISSPAFYPDMVAGSPAGVPASAVTDAPIGKR